MHSFPRFLLAVAGLCTALFWLVWCIIVGYVGAALVTLLGTVAWSVLSSMGPSFWGAFFVTLCCFLVLSLGGSR